jgi:signal transduction histidine kinase
MDNPVYPDFADQEPSQNTPDNSEDVLSQSSMVSPVQDNSQEMDHLESELRMTLEEIARLQNALAEANMKLMAVTSSSNSQSKDVTAESLLQPMVKELRQPLVTIKGYLDLLLNESVGSLGTFQRRFVERIQKAVDHLEESFDTISRNPVEEQHDRHLFTQSFSVRKTIESALDLFINTIRSKEIVLKINIPFDDIRLFEDKEDFEQILNLLFTNATTSINPGGSFMVDVEEYLTLQPQEVLITIGSSDRNVSPVELLPVLPEMFKNQSLTLPGFGLPLEDIVRADKYAEKMGGKIEFYSNSIGAMVAKIRLPLVQGEIL